MFLEAATFTIISLGINDAKLDNHLITGDVFKLDKSANIIATSGVGIFPFGGQISNIPTTFIDNVSPSFTTWGMGLQISNPVNEIHLAFEKVGINRDVGDKFLFIAKGILAELNYPNIKVNPLLIRDPEENSSYLTLRLHVNTSFEESLALDSKLTRELVHRTTNIPENLSFAVYEME